MSPAVSTLKSSVFTNLRGVVNDDVNAVNVNAFRGGDFDDEDHDDDMNMMIWW